MRHGFGTLLFKNGAVFQGHFQNNIKQGFGKMQAVNGDEYIGKYHKINQRLFQK